MHEGVEGEGEGLEATEDVNMIDGDRYGAYPVCRDCAVSSTE